MITTLNYLVEKYFCTNPKSFGDFVRKNRKVSNLPTAVKLNGISSIDRTTIYELFSKQFSSVFSLHGINFDSCVPVELPYDLPYSCNINLTDVESSLVKLGLTKSIGPDGLLGFLFINSGLFCVF
jgi:hypothetical protein